MATETETIYLVYLVSRIGRDEVDWLARYHLHHWRKVMNHLRQLALALLDDDYGITEKAWNLLHHLLAEAGYTDIIAAVREQDGRYYLPTGFKG